MLLGVFRFLSQIDQLNQFFWRRESERVRRYYRQELSGLPTLSWGLAGRRCFGEAKEGGRIVQRTV